MLVSEIVILDLEFTVAVLTIVLLFMCVLKYIKYITILYIIFYRL